MFEPPILGQLMGVGAVAIGFIGAGLVAQYMDDEDKRKAELKRKEQEVIDDAVIRAVQEGIELERRRIRNNIRQGDRHFTYDVEPPEGLRPEPLALPEPRRVRYAHRMG